MYDVNSCDIKEVFDNICLAITYDGTINNHGVYGCFATLQFTTSGVIKFFSQPLLQDKWPVKIHLS